VKPEASQPGDAYEFEPGDGDVAAASLDAAYAGAMEWHEVVDALRGHSRDPSVQATLTPLELAVQRVTLFVLRLSLMGEPPGCSLGPQWEDGHLAYPARIGEVADSQVKLWDAAASKAREPAVLARLHDLLYVRGSPLRRQHAEQAITAYLDAAQSMSPTGLHATEMLVRAWDIQRRMQLWHLSPRIEDDLHSAADQGIHSTDYMPGAVLPLLAALAARPTKNQPPDARRTAQDTASLQALIRRAVARFKTDYLLAELFGLLRSLSPSEEEREHLKREECLELLELAKRGDGLLRQGALEHTVRRSQAFGCMDIAQEATRLLQQITVADLGLETLSTELLAPRDWIERYVEQFTRAPNWRVSLGYFRQTPPPTGSHADLKEQEAATRGTSIARLVTRITLTSEGLPKQTAWTPELEQAAEVAWLASWHAAHHGNLLAEALEAIRRRYGPLTSDSLTEFFSRHGQGDKDMAKVLASAFQHFWNHDYHATVHVIVPQIEGAARALLLELNAAVYQVQVGADPGGYGGLFELLRALEELGLDPDWCFYLRWLLVSPGGPNLRNEIAHGLVLEADAVTAAHALRAATLLIDLLAPKASRAVAAERRSRDELRALLTNPIATQRPWPSARGGYRDGLGKRLEQVGRALWRAGGRLRRA
jgi:hypothetical protein